MEGKNLKQGPGRKDGGFTEKGDAGYRESVSAIRDELGKVSQSFIKIGWHLKRIKEGGGYRKDGYKDIYDFAEGMFHISRSAAIRLINLCREFSEGGDSDALDRKYRGFTVSKLVEMLPMGREQRKGITPDMTVSQIRRMKKAGGGGRPAGGSAAGGPGRLPCRTDVEAFRPGAAGEQPALPEPWDDAGWVEWLAKAEAWGMWYEDPNIHARYYKYDFPDGGRLVAEKHPGPCRPGTEGEGMEYHIFLPGRHAEGHGGLRERPARPGEVTPGFISILKNLQAGGYRSNEYIMEGFDPDHPEDAEGFVCRKYAEFYAGHGYIPRFFYPKSCREVLDYAPTLATSCGTDTGMGSVIVFDAPSEVALIVDNGLLDFEEAVRRVYKVLRIAEPGERRRAEEILFPGGGEQAGPSGGQGSAGAA